MPFMNVDDQMHGHRKFVKLGRDRLEATGLWTTAGSWCASALTDGFVPDYIVAQWDPEFRNALRLCDVGLWHPAKREDEDGYQFHDWTDDRRNLSSDEIKQKRADNAARQQRYRDRQKRKAEERADQEQREHDASRDASRNALRDASLPPDGKIDSDALRDALVTRHMTPSHPIPSHPLTEEETSSLLVTDGSAAVDAASVVREDVEAVCERLALKVAENTGRRPAITEQWRTSARLLLDRDLAAEPEAQRLVEAVIDWATGDEFWRTNVLGMPKLRKQFDQLRMKRRLEAERQGRAVSTGSSRNGRRNADDKIRALLGDSPTFPGGPSHLRALPGGSPS